MTKYIIALMIVTIGAGYMFYELRHPTKIDHNAVIAEIKRNKDTRELDSWPKNIKEKNKVTEETPPPVAETTPPLPDKKPEVDEPVEQPENPPPLPDRKPKVTKVAQVADPEDPAEVAPPEVENAPPPEENQTPAVEWNPGCTPKHNVPEAVTSYFKSFNKPLPQQYCQEVQHEAQTPPQQQEQAPSEDQLDGGSPDQQQQEQAPPPQNEQQQAPPPQDGQQQAPLPPPVHGHIWHGPPTPNSQTPECGYWNNFCGQEAPVPGGAGGYPQVYVQPQGFVLRSPWVNLAIPFFHNGWQRRQARQERRAYRQWRRNQY